MTSRHSLFLAASLLAFGGAAGAWAAGAPAAPAAATASSAALTTGEVRKVDAAQGKVTIKHEAISNLDMPAMTMIFRAEKPELLKNVKAGDRIRFHAESDKGTLVVTRIELAK